MKIVLNTEACQGHGRCYSYSPELFDADEEGHAVLLVSDLAADQESAARQAVEACPEEALTLDG